MSEAQLSQLSRFISERLAAEDLTQAEFARQLEVSQPTIHALLNGAEPKKTLYDKLIRRYPQIVGFIFNEAAN